MPLMPSTALSHVRHFSRASNSLRHFLSIKDLSSTELKVLIDNSTKHKKTINASRAQWPLRNALAGRTIPLIFSKRSTRTRVSSEGAVVALGGHPMFLGKDDIQLGVNESLYDTARVISSMSAGIIARVGPHKDVADLAKDSSVPVINALCDTYHPMQAVADFACLTQALNTNAQGLKGLKIAWVGDANNVLHDMCLAAKKLGVHMAVATPKGYELSSSIKRLIAQAGDADLTETNDPQAAVKGANVIVTDTWISMGQEAEKAKKMKEFEGFQVTMDMIRKGGAAKDWKFMHCMPRHAEEVSDEVFYSDNSLVFLEAENRLWSAIAVLEAFIVNKGSIQASTAS